MFIVMLLSIQQKISEKRFSQSFWFVASLIKGWNHHRFFFACTRENETKGKYSTMVVMRHLWRGFSYILLFFYISFDPYDVCDMSK
jgi:hypothetical protein